MTGSQVRKEVMAELVKIAAQAIADGLDGLVAGGRRSQYRSVVAGDRTDDRWRDRLARDQRGACGVIGAAQKKGPAEAATSPSRGSNIPGKENAVNDSTDTTAPAKSASETPREKFRGRDAFEKVLRDWRLTLIGPDDDAQDSVTKAWEMGWEDVHLAQQALAFQVPHLCCLRDKLDIIIHYASTAGSDLDVHERLVLNGIMALRADIVNFGG